MAPKLFLSNVATLFNFIIFVAFLLGVTNGIGVNYGMVADNLPSPDKVVSLCKSRGISGLRLFDPNQPALAALKNSGIGVVLGAVNDDIENLAASPSFADQWVATNVLPFAQSVNFRYISVGNEVFPGGSDGRIAPAMENLYAALKRAGQDIPVSTAVSMGVVTGYPPSQGAFVGTSAMTSIVEFLQANRLPLLVNVYPYFAYKGDPNKVRLDYALFTATGVVVQDGGLGYSNLFDALVDTAYAALEKAGGPDVEIVVSESGWPSGGGEIGASVENAQTYNNNLVAHVEKSAGTPKKPGKKIDTYIFALFNENKKAAGIEQNFGLYYPDMTEVYHVNLSP